MTPGEIKTEEAVIDMIRSRGEVGREKYKKSMDRNDLTMNEWITHYQEEMADGLQYAERMKGAAQLLQDAHQEISRMAATNDPWAIDWCDRYDQQFGGAK